MIIYFLSTTCIINCHLFVKYLPKRVFSCRTEADINNIVHESSRSNNFVRWFLQAK